MGEKRGQMALSYGDFYVSRGRWLTNSSIKLIKAQLMIYFLKNVEPYFKNVELIF